MKPTKFSDLKDGQSFTCEINGDKIFGKITVEREKVFLCQNNMSGTSPHDLKGFKFGWCIGHINHIFSDKMINTGITNLEVFDFSPGDVVVFNSSGSCQTTIGNGRCSIELGIEHVLIEQNEMPDASISWKMKNKRNGDITHAVLYHPKYNYHTYYKKIEDVNIPIEDLVEGEYYHCHDKAGFIIFKFLKRNNKDKNRPKSSFLLQPWIVVNLEKILNFIIPDEMDEKQQKKKKIGWIIVLNKINLLIYLNLII